MEGAAGLDELAKVPLFEGIPRRQLKRIADLAEVVEAEDGDELVREGTFGRQFFVMLSGSAKVTIRGRRLRTIGPGESFGELAILNKSARSATVTAIEPSRLAVIGAPEFQELVESEPKIALYMLGTLARELEHLTTRPTGETM